MHTRRILLRWWYIVDVTIRHYSKEKSHCLHKYDYLQVLNKCLFLAKQKNMHQMCLSFPSFINIIFHYIPISDEIMKKVMKSSTGSKWQHLNPVTQCQSSLDMVIPWEWTSISLISSVSLIPFAVLNLCVSLTKCCVPMSMKLMPWTCLHLI